MLRCRGLPLTCVMLCIHHNVGIDAGIRPGLLSAPDSQVWHTTQAQLDEERKRELQSVIQAHFKEWLLSSGNMRQVRRFECTCLPIEYDCVPLPHNNRCASVVLNSLSFVGHIARPALALRDGCTQGDQQDKLCVFLWLSLAVVPQVYDLARMERDDPPREDGPSSGGPAL